MIAKNRRGLNEHSRGNKPVTSCSLPVTVGWEMTNCNAALASKKKALAQAVPSVWLSQRNDTTSDGVFKCICVLLCKGTAIVWALYGHKSYKSWLLSGNIFFLLSNVSACYNLHYIFLSKRKSLCLCQSVTQFFLTFFWVPPNLGI